MNLTKDQFGNYVIQHVLEHGRQQDKDFVLNKMRRRILEMSTHKFGSNVIEKCILHCTLKQRRDIIKEIVGDKTENDAPLYQMIKDRFGNYVVQKTYEMAEPQDKKVIAQKVLDIVPLIKKQNNYSKHVFTFLEKNGV